jgi:hypothetical protein
MKRFLVIIISTIFLNVDSFTQISSFGLQGMKVTDLKIYGDTLYAATFDSGVFRRNLNDTGWVNLGLKEKNITCVYPHPVDSQGYNLTVGVYGEDSPDDTSIIYSLSSSGWVADDSGITDHGSFGGIYSIDGFESYGMTNIFFAGGDYYYDCLNKRSNTIWQRVSQNFPGKDCFAIFVVKRSPINDIWIGGWGTVLKSTDKGDTWTDLDVLHPNTWYNNDIEFHPFNPDIVYIPTSVLQKSTDGGLSWEIVNTPYQGYQKIEIDPFYDNHFFIGSASYWFTIHETTNGGLSWDSISTPLGAEGLNDIEINLRDSLELYIATYGTGVYRLTQPSLACGRMINVNEGWNMLSVPNRVHDFCKNTLLPSSISSAFTYENSYINKDTLQNGKGYWSKFNSSNVIKFIGEKITSDSIDVNLGWNMIGSISYPVRVSSISSDPPDMIVNDFFTYTDNQYVSSDTIQPGHAYWVKTNKSGKLILDTTSSIMTNKLIQIVPNGELPPPPPDYEIRNQKPEIPIKFALEQNYPNPFNPVTIINYQLPIDNWVTLKVYNIFGQEVRTLVDGMLVAGYKSAEFDARNLASGVYYYKLTVGGFVDVKKMILLR